METYQHETGERLFKVNHMVHQSKVLIKPEKIFNSKEQNRINCQSETIGKVNQNGAAEQRTYKS